jgi:hypothetical protein
VVSSRALTSDTNEAWDRLVEIPPDAGTLTGERERRGVDGLEPEAYGLRVPSL